MPLYELVLDFEDGGQEVRLTDQPMAVGDTIEIDWVDWIVVHQAAASARVTARFECVRARFDRERAQELRSKNRRLTGEVLKPPFESD